jgi:hypothetical protein
MKKQPSALAFKDKVQAFLDQLEIARLEVGDILNGTIRRNVDDFCMRVSNAVRSCYRGEQQDEITVSDTMKPLGNAEDWSNVDGFLFRVVELVERRLFTANTAFGLSFNLIASHYRHWYNEINQFSFAWTIKLKDIREPSTYPTIESTLRDIKWRRDLRMRMHMT